LTKDVVEGVEEIPLTQNPYAYCEANPINCVDPDGNEALTIGVSIVGSAVSIKATVAALVISVIIVGAVVTVKTRGKPPYRFRIEIHRPHYPMPKTIKATGLKLAKWLWRHPDFRYHVHVWWMGKRILRI
jgi:hypothetical protein